MFRSAVRLLAFAHVAVLCACMATNFTGSSTVGLKNNSFTTSPSPNNTSASISSGDTPNVEVNPDAVNSTHTHPPHGTTDTSDQTNVTHREHQGQGPVQPVSTLAPGNTTMESPETDSNTTESTTAKATIATAPSGGDQSGGGKVVDEPSSTGRGAGIFFLLFIIFVIIILAVVLYVLWKKGKRYSFDLNNGEHDTPLRSMEHTGTFEPTKGSTMNLDYVQEEKTNKSSPVANGCSGETPDQTPSAEQQNVPEEDSFSSDLSLDLPVKKVEFNLDLELIGADPEPAKEDTVETTDNDNENNNNDTDAGIDSADLFTEINLDDVQ